MARRVPNRVRTKHNGSNCIVQIYINKTIKKEGGGGRGWGCWVWGGRGGGGGGERHTDDQPAGVEEEAVVAAAVAPIRFPRVRSARLVSSRLVLHWGFVCKMCRAGSIEPDPVRLGRRAPEPTRVNKGRCLADLLFLFGAKSLIVCNPLQQQSQVNHMPQHGIDNKHSTESMRLTRVHDDSRLIMVFIQIFILEKYSIELHIFKKVIFNFNSPYIIN